MIPLLLSHLCWSAAATSDSNYCRVLALSGGGGIVLGSVEFVRCHGPLTRDEWVSGANRHCVAGSSLPYGSSTYAWEMASPVRFHTPVPYEHKQGVVVWAKK